MRRPALNTNFVTSTTDPVSLGRTIAQMWQNLKTAINPFIESPRALTNVIEFDLVNAVDGGGNPIPNVIDHKLPLNKGTTPEGWCITDIDTATTVYRIAWDDKTISLFPGLNCHVKFEVW